MPFFKRKIVKEFLREAKGPLPPPPSQKGLWVQLEAFSECSLKLLSLRSALEGPRTKRT